MIFETASAILFLSIAAPLAAAPITFESPDYVTSTPVGTTGTRFQVAPTSAANLAFFRLRISTW